MKDYYLLLGLSKNASNGDIKRAYRDSAKQCHPDSAGSTCDSRQFRDIKEAYDTLSDKQRKADYDRNLASRRSSIQQPTTDSLRPHVQNFNRNTPPRTEPFAGPQNRMRRILTCDIYLTAQQLNSDMTCPCTILVQQPCPFCRDDRLMQLFQCPVCHNRGTVNSTKELLINIPEGTPWGTCVDLPLEHVGLTDVDLRVRVLHQPGSSGMP